MPVVVTWWFFRAEGGGEDGGWVDFELSNYDYQQPEFHLLHLSLFG